MKKLLAIALLALAAMNANASAAELPTGVWCETLSVNNGHGELRDNFYERKADCPEVDVWVFDRHSFNGIRFEVEDGKLRTWGTPKRAKKGN